MVKKYLKEITDIKEAFLRSVKSAFVPSFVRCFDMVLSTFIFLKNVKTIINLRSHPIKMFKDTKITSFQMIFIQHKR